MPDISKLSGIAIDSVAKLSGVAKSSIAKVGDVSKAVSASIITTNLTNQYTPADYSGSGDLLDDVGSRDINISGATYNSSTPANFDFDGVNDSGLSDAFSQPAQDLSFGFWMNRDTNPSSTMVIGGVITSGFLGIIVYDNGSNLALYQRHVQLSNTSTSYSPTTGAWAYICVSRNNGSKNLRMWKFDSNGSTKLIDKTGVSQTGSISNTFIVYSPAQFRYNGQMGNMQVYNDDLEESEWTQNFNAQKANYGL